MKKKVGAQKQLINEFENYLTILLKIVKESNLNEYAERIKKVWFNWFKKGLDKIEPLCKDNIETKINLIKEIKK